MEGRWKLYEAEDAGGEEGRTKKRFGVEQRAKTQRVAFQRHFGPARHAMRACPH